MGKRPNVVCFISDDTDFSLIGAYGSKIKTPNIDSIAEEGVKFENMHCASSVCTASRYSYLTGQYVGRCEDEYFLKSNPADEPYNVHWNAVVNENMWSLGRVMSENGYQTGYVGKWHTGWPMKYLPLPELDPDSDPDDPEVDAKLKEFQQVLVERVKKDGGFQYAASITWDNNEAFPVKKLQHHNLDWMAKGALDFLSNVNTDEPFILYIATTTFHGPPHEKSYEQDVSLTQAGRMDLSGTGMPDRKKIHERLEKYGLPYNHNTVGMIWMDDLVGVLLNKLKEMGVEDNTIFFWNTDHNTEPGKGTCYYAGTHIPMLMKWPGKIEPKTVCHARVQNIDFLPTLFDACNIVPPKEMKLDGKSMLPVLFGREKELHEELYFEFGWARAVLWKNWKYIALRYPKTIIEKMKSGELKEAPNHINIRMQPQMNIAIEHYPGYFDGDELYNLDEDPEEKRNLAFNDAYKDIIDIMRKKLKKYTDSFKHPFPIEENDFYRTELFKKLVEETKKIGTDYIEWWPKAAGI